MALAVRGYFLQRLYPLVQAKRFRGKINIQRPKPVHFERAVVMELTKPWFINPKKGKTRVEMCSIATEKVVDEIENPYQKLIAGELKCLLDNSKITAFYHCNPMNGEKRFNALVAFKKAGMDFKNYGRKTVEMAVVDTKYEAILDFYITHNMMVFSPEVDVKSLLKISKKFPEIVLLAAIFEGKLISKDELVKLELIPNLETAQAMLVQTLNSAGSTLVQQLNSHQTSLVSNLDQRVKQLEEENK